MDCVGDSNEIVVLNSNDVCTSYQNVYDCTDNGATTNTNVIPGNSGPATGAVTLTTANTTAGDVHVIQNQAGDSVTVTQTINGNLESINEVEQHILRAPACTGTPATIRPQTESKVNTCLVRTTGGGNSAIALNYPVTDDNVTCQIEGLLVGQDTSGPNLRSSIGFTLQYDLGGVTLNPFAQTDIIYRRLGDPDHSLDLINVTQSGGPGSPIEINIIDNSNPATQTQWTMKTERICVRQVTAVP